MYIYGEGCKLTKQNRYLFRWILFFWLMKIRWFSKRFEAIQWNSPISLWSKKYPEIFLEKSWNLPRKKFAPKLKIIIFSSAKKSIRMRKIFFWKTQIKPKINDKKGFNIFKGSRFFSQMLFFSFFSLIL